MVASQSLILPAAECLNHDEASRLADLALAGGAQPVVLDLSRCVEATTAAFARLILLRRDLMHNGRDLRIAGLANQPAQLFEVHRLEGILPLMTQLPLARPRPSAGAARAPSSPVLAGGH